MFEQSIVNTSRRHLLAHSPAVTVLAAAGIPLLDAVIGRLEQLA